jgi:hypothetical protein
LLFDISEAVGVSATFSPIFTYRVIVSETAQLTSTQAVLTNFVTTVSESIRASSQQTSTAAIITSLAESARFSNTQAIERLVFAAIIQQGFFEELTFPDNAFNVDVAEQLRAAGASAGLVDFYANLNESINALDQYAVNSLLFNNILEAISASSIAFAAGLWGPTGSTPNGDWGDPEGGGTTPSGGWGNEPAGETYPSGGWGPIDTVPN